ncbi:MAG: tellurite resistance TerB family protein [Desulfobacterales bacterium]|nr:tellurite resistance TerB family protein [Desulfobacterales bacterium]
MSFLDWVKQKKDEISTEIKRFKNADFMEAISAGCAMVAVADGFVSPEEKQKMAGFIKRNDALKIFDMNKVIESFNKYADNFEFDFNIGKGEALKVISKIKKDQGAARLLIQVCIAIGSSDGKFDPSEQKIVKEICHALGLEPKEFGLE